MKKYPRIYSLSTIGIIHHQKNDYIFHPYCTDFIGDSDSGKSIIADLEAVLISFDKSVKHDLDECNLYHSFCGFSKEFVIDGQPSEVFQP